MKFLFAAEDVVLGILAGALLILYSGAFLVAGNVFWMILYPFLD